MAPCLANVVSRDADLACFRSFFEDGNMTFDEEYGCGDGTFAFVMGTFGTP